MGEHARPRQMQSHERNRGRGSGCILAEVGLKARIDSSHALSLWSSHNADCDFMLVAAAAFSESSMFVWPHKMILKTCGTTTLLLGMDRLLEIAREECGLTETYRCFYSRKAFMFPERQVGPHRHWDEEVKVLDSYFGKSTACSMTPEVPHYLVWPI